MQLNYNQFTPGTRGASCTATSGQNILWTCKAKKEDDVPEILSDLAREPNPALRWLKIRAWVSCQEDTSCNCAQW
jgi:hypothetical protein